MTKVARQLARDIYTWVVAERNGVHGKQNGRPELSHILQYVQDSS
jgi:hypothetical protein